MPQRWKAWKISHCWSCQSMHQTTDILKTEVWNLPKLDVMKLLIRPSSATHKTPVILETSTCLQSTAPVGFRLHTWQFCRCLYIFFMTSYSETLDINVASWFLSWPCGCTQNRIAYGRASSIQAQSIKSMLFGHILYILYILQKMIWAKKTGEYTMVNIYIYIYIYTCWAKFHGHILFGRLTTSVVVPCRSKVPWRGHG